jgi:hypothetical protein
MVDFFSLERDAFLTVFDDATDVTGRQKGSDMEFDIFDPNLDDLLDANVRSGIGSQCQQQV